MDFSLSEDQTAVQALARRIVEDLVTPDTLRAADEGADHVDRTLWRALASAGLLGISLPEALGGGGCGLLEQCLVLEELGRGVAPVPVLASIVLGAAPIAAFGSEAQQQQWVVPAAEGRTILTAALAEPANDDRRRPSTTARRQADGFVLDGVKTVVPAAPLADAVLVPATFEGDTAMFIVAGDGPGVRIERQETTGGVSTGQVTLDGAAVPAGARLGGPDGADGAAVLEWMIQRAVLGACAVQLGVLEQAVAQTAAYATSRVQFGRPIGTFQAVGHRLADGYIDVEATRLTLLQAVWRLSAGLDARTEVEVAKYWAAQAGHRVAHAAVHLHGGMGVARSHTLHRYFLAAEHHEFLFGGATEQLLGIGAALAGPDGGSVER